MEIRPIRGRVRKLFISPDWDLDWNWPELVVRGDMGTVVNALVRDSKAGRSNLVLTLNLDIWRQLVKGYRHRRDWMGYGSVLLDGSPIVWAFRSVTGRSGHRVTGADLLPALSRVAVGAGLHVHYSGGGPDVAKRVAADFKAPGGLGRTSYSAFEIGRDASILTENAQKIVELHPDIVFAAYGFPKQDLLGAAIIAASPGTTVIGCGAAFDFALGRYRRAPAIVQRFHMEWVVRLLQEPRRLGPRYLRHGVPAVLPFVHSVRRLRLARRTTETGIIR